MPAAIEYDGNLTCALRVTDLERSKLWFQDVLGFTFLYQVDEIGWCELATEQPGVTVGLSQVERAGGEGNAILTFGVKNLDAARAELETKSVAFDGPTQTIEGMVKLATFFDPDRNAFMLAQDLRS
jgi:predicted enzyme related to lactoylglutathione lyase